MAFPAYPHAPVTSTLRRPAVTGGSFVLNGGSSPTVVSGSIESVRRLTVSAAPFFRVRFSHEIGRVGGGRALTGPLSLTVHTGDETAAGSAREGDLVDDGGDVRDDLREIDVTVTVGATAQADTAGARVDVLWLMDLSPRS
jgi:hypothetical protein